MPRAKRVIYLYMAGGPSHLELFDHKPELAKRHGLDVWDKPASPCLSSRIAYGIEATPERVARIDAAVKAAR